MNNLFEYIFVDPLAIWEYPDLLKHTSVRYGYILCDERTLPIDKQIEELIPINQGNRWRLDYICEMLMKLKTDDAKQDLSFYKNHKISNKNIRPKFLQDTDEWASTINLPYVCIVSEQNKNQKVADNQKGVHIDPLKFLYENCQGKEVSYVHDGFTAVKVLSRILPPQIFNRCIHQIDIVDYHVQNIGLFPKSNKLTNYLTTIEQMCLSLFEKYFFNRKVPPSIPMKINIFFRDHTNFDLEVFEEHWDDHIKKRPKFSKLNKKLEINFFCLSYIEDGRAINAIHDRWCFSKSFLIQTPIGICSKPGKIIDQKGRIKWKLIPTEENKRLSEQVDYLENIQKWFRKNTTEYKALQLSKVY